MKIRELTTADFGVAVLHAGELFDIGLGVHRGFDGGASVRDARCHGTRCPGTLR